MKTGLLWFDDNPRKDLEEKVLRAVAHYERKHGRTPDLCYVHPTSLGNDKDGQPKKAGSVEIRLGRAVLPHHFWLGVSEKQRTTPANTPAKGAPAKPASVPHPSLVHRVKAAETPMTREEARQLALALENR